MESLVCYGRMQIAASSLSQGPANVSASWVISQNQNKSLKPQYIVPPLAVASA